MTFSAPIRSMLPLPQAWSGLISDLDAIFDRIGLAGFSVSVAPPSFPPGPTGTDPLPTLQEALDLFASDPEGGRPENDGPLDPVGALDSTAPVLGVVEPPEAITAQLSIEALSDVVLALPGLDAVMLVLNPGTFNVTATRRRDATDLSATLTLAVRIDPTFLRPAKQVATSDGGIGYEPDETQPWLQIPLAATTVTIGADGSWSIVGSVGFQIAQPLLIGDTGVVIESATVVLNLDGAGPRPTNSPAGWKGVYLQSASVRIPALFQGAIVANGLGIGSGGVTGDIGAAWSAYYDANLGQFQGNGATNVFGLPCGLHSLSISLKDNVPIGSSVKAGIKLPFFDRAAEVEIGLTKSGGFIVGLNEASTGGLATLQIAGILDLELDSLKFQVDDGLLTVQLSGLITPTLPALNCPPIRIDKLKIDSKGHVDLPGGWLDMPNHFGLDFHSFKIEITKFGLGRNPDGTKWVGFSGGIKLVDGLPAGVSVDGLRITAHEDWSNPHVSLNGVGVELEIKDVLYFKGAVAYRELNGGHRFDGGIHLELKSLKLSVDGGFVVGNTNTYRYMAVYLGVDLPTGVPVGTTGLGLYGLAGLFALRMEPDKRPTEQWYGITASDNWYKRGTVGVTDLTKWTNQPSSKGFGAGLTFGTYADNGFTFAGKALFVAVFPGPILMLEGKCNLLKDRAKLSDEPLFRSLAVLDNRAGTLLIGLDVKYQYDAAAGKLIKLAAGTEAYYEFADPTAWHIYLGINEPRDRRVQARILSLFDANAYVMLTAHSLAMGAWVGYDQSWKFGPLKVALQAWMENNAVVGFKPLQLHGDLWAHGAVDLEAFGFGLGLTVDARVAADVFRPRHLLGEFDVALHLPKPLAKKKLEAHCKLEWGPDPDAPPVPLALKGVSIEHLKVAVTWPLPAPAHGLLQPDWDDGEGFLAGAAGGDIDAVPAVVPVVPLDCRPSISFARNVHDDAMVGVVVQTPDPQWEWIGDPDRHEGSARVRYGLQAVVLEKLQAGQWTAVAGKGPGLSNLPELFGSWAPAPAAGGSGVAQNKLLLWSKCGFDSTRLTGSEWGDWFAGAFGGPSGYPCIPTPGPSELCLDFTGLDAGEASKLPLRHPGHPDVSFSSPSGVLEVNDLGVRKDGSPKALCGAGGVDIHFDPPADHIRVTAMAAAGVTAVATAYDLAGNVLQTTHMSPAFELWANFAPQQFAVLGAPGVSKVSVRASGGPADGVCLTKVCAILPPSPQQLALLAEGRAHNQQAVSLWSGTGAVLEPYTQYRLRVVTTIQTEDFQYGGGFNQTRTLTQAAFFRTEGPPGLAQLSIPLEPPTTEFDSGLGDLGRYVRQTVPTTVPAMGEKPLAPRPVYRAYDVGVAFNEDYVDLMYRLAGRDLAVMLHDRNNLPVRDRAGCVAAAANPWGVAERLSLSDQESSWLAMLQPNQCVPSVDQTQIPHDLTLAAPAELLAPDMLYQARLKPLLLHEDFSRIGPGTGRWQAFDLTSDGGASAWSVAPASAPDAWRMVQAGSTGAATDGPDTTATALALGPDPRHPADDPAAWSDYRASAWLRADSGAAVGLAVRWRDPQTFYLFAMDETAGRALYRISGGTAVTLASDPTPLAHGHDYQVVVEANGAALRVHVDGEAVFDVTDPAPITSGSIALHCSACPGAAFTDVQVHDLSTAALSVYDFSFTTSRFVNFHHQVHSHDDDAWPGLCTLGAADLAAALAQAATDPAAPVADAEARAFEVLADDILGPYARQEAPRTETYRVAANGDGVGLLVRSPEPFDFRRLSVSAFQAGETTPASVAPGAVKLIGAVLDASQAADEGVTLLVRAPCDLSGWRLEQRDPAAAALALDDPAAAWTSLYQFGTEAVLREGTQVCVWSGDPSTAPSPAAGRIDRFRAALGDPAVPVLTGDRADLRLVNGKGGVEHARRFLKDAAYAPFGFRLLRKADGTAFFLLPAGGTLASEALRLELAFRRDNRGIDPDSLVLSQAGDRSDETAVIDVPTTSPIPPPDDDGAG